MKRYTSTELNMMTKEEVIALVLQVQEQNMIFQEQIFRMQDQRFGRKTEQLSSLLQGSFFNEFEAEAAKATNEPETTEGEQLPQKNKKKPGTLDKTLEKLHHSNIYHDMPEEELEKIFGKNGWKQLPYETYRKLVYHPATKEVEVHHVAVYAAKNGDGMCRAPHPAELLPHSVASPSIVAAIMNAKYTNAVPLYRIGKEFERYGVEIPGPTLANWVIRCSERYLSLLTDRLKDELCKLSVVQADETSCKVSKDGRPANSESRMFVYRSGELDKSKPIVLFDFQKTRSADHVLRFLGTFSGVLVTDAYEAYHKVGRIREDIQVAHCWAHARRSFADAIKSLQKKGGPSKQAIKKSVAYQALERIGVLYALEGEWEYLTAEERRIRRQEHSKPLVEAYFAWVKGIDPTTIVSESTREGLRYSINQEPYLRRYLENGSIPIDNSASERAIRPFCVGRANWHIIDSVHGAEASAIVYSIVETAKANNLKPYEYLKHLLTEIPKHTNGKTLDFLDDLLPWSEALPQACRKV